MDELERPAKRHRPATRRQTKLAEKEQEQTPQGPTGPAEDGAKLGTQCPLDLSLYVRHFPAGSSKVSALPLRPVDSLDELEGLSKSLVARAYRDERPDYLSSEEFYQLTPAMEYMSLPSSDIERTRFRLVVTHEGWEHTVLERELGEHRDTINRNMLVTVIEFSSHAQLMGAIGLHVCLVAFPVISIRKVFVDEVAAKLSETNFNGFLEQAVA